MLDLTFPTSIESSLSLCLTLSVHCAHETINQKNEYLTRPLHVFYTPRTHLGENRE